MQLTVDAEHRIVPAGVGGLKLVNTTTGAVLAVATIDGPWTVAVDGADPVVVAAEDVVVTMVDEARKALPGYPDNALVVVAAVGEAPE